LYIILRGCWYVIVVLNIHAPTEDTIDVKGRFYELEPIFDKFHILYEHFVLTVKSTMFPQRDIHKFNSTYPDGKTRSKIEHILIDARWH
jgi:hypothetical protein